MRGRLHLVDDDVHVRTMLQEYLETHGYTVEMAANDREALAKLHQAHFDLMMTDYDMPEVDGPEVLRPIR